MNWISVKDELPEPVTEGAEADKWKLCCTGFGAILLSLCYYNHGSDEWFDGFNAHPETRITHWMTLPEPPIDPTK
jgi:hypothetical protein